MEKASHPGCETEDLVEVLSFIVSHAVSKVVHSCLDALARLVGGIAAHSSDMSVRTQEGWKKPLLGTRTHVVAYSNHIQLNHNYHQLPTVLGFFHTGRVSIKSARQTGSAGG